MEDVMLSLIVITPVYFASVVMIQEAVLHAKQMLLYPGFTRVYVKKDIIKTHQQEIVFNVTQHVLDAVDPMLTIVFAVNLMLFLMQMPKPVNVILTSH